MKESIKRALSVPAGHVGHIPANIRPMVELVINAVSDPIISVAETGSVYVKDVSQPVVLDDGYETCVTIRIADHAPNPHRVHSYHTVDVRV